MSKKGIHNEAFKGQTTILSADFRNECYSIGDSAFEGCTSLKNIDKDDEYNKNVVETIGIRSFADCKSLSEVSFPKVTSIGDRAFEKCEKLTYVNIPNCNHIGTYAFIDCTKLEIIENQEIAIVESEILDGAFQNCSALNYIYIDNCIHIGNEAFMNCKTLNRAKLNKCKYIGKNAFKNCENITQVTLSVCEKIDIDAFSGCSNLKSVYVKNSYGIVCELGDSNNPYVFCDCDSSQLNDPCNCNIKFYFRSDTYENIINDVNELSEKWKKNWGHYMNNIIVMPQNNQIIYTSNDDNIIEVCENIENLIESNEYKDNRYGLIQFKNKVEKLDEKIFKNPERLISIDIPIECESILDGVFEDCINLQNITIFGDLTAIGKYAFKNCQSLKSFTIPNSLISLGDGAFAGCKNIEYFDGEFVVNEGKYNKKAVVCNGKLICVSQIDKSDTEGRIHKISEIDNNISILGDACFYGHVNMRRIDISSNVTHVGDNAFEGCENLYEVHFEGTEPPTIGNDVFKDVETDFKIFVPESSFEKYHNTWVTTSSYASYKDHIYPKPTDDSIIYYTDDSIKIDNQTYVESTLPNGIYYKISNVKDATLPSGYFYNTPVKKVILGDGINKLSVESFKECTKLEYIYLSDNITEFNNRCFYNCSSLTRIHIPIGLKSKIEIENNIIVNGSTNGSTNVSTNGSTNNIIPNNFVTQELGDYFGNETFCGCKKLKEFGTYYKGYVSDDNRCYVCKNVLKFFAQGELSDDVNYKLPNMNITEIYNYAFKGTNISSIDLNDNPINNINKYAFEDCQNLSSIYNWNGVKYINEFAFKNCKKLSAINLPINLSSIGEYAFEGCELMYLENNIPENLSYIGKGAFKNCKSFNSGSELNLSNVQNIYTSTFENCTSLKGVIISNKTKEIQSYAFANCTYLGNLFFSSQPELTSINTSAFENCTNLNISSLPDSINFIGNYAFNGCEKMSDLTLPIYLQTMGDKCLKSNMTITIPQLLSTPPKFMSNSKPFDVAQLNNNKLKIQMPFELEYTYRNNSDWAQYSYSFIATGINGRTIEDFLEVSCKRDGLYLKFKTIPYAWSAGSINFNIHDIGNQIIKSGSLKLERYLSNKDADIDQLTFKINLNLSDHNKYLAGMCFKIVSVSNNPALQYNSNKYKTILSTETL